jgi:hypothetical protein
MDSIRPDDCAKNLRGATRRYITNAVRKLDATFIVSAGQRTSIATPLNVTLAGGLFG